MKFSERGDVRVNTSVESEDEAYTVVRFSVKDSGIGIPPEAEGRLFSSFTQADGSTTRRYGGTGLGLAICKQLVERMGGQIGFNSVVDKGSEFWFTARLDKQADQCEMSARDVTLLKGRRALIVDDNESSRKILRHYAVSWQMEPSEAAGGPDALAILTQGRAAGKGFDFVLSDLMMPGMDGIELAEEIRRQSLGDDAHMVMLSSYKLRRSQDAERLREAGIEASLTKPIKKSQLRDCLVKLLASSAAAGKAPPRAGAKTKPATGVRARRASARGGHILLAEDNVVNQKMALKMLEKMGYSADVVGNGLAALDALARTRYDLILMDCQMPQMDGYEATAEIRRREGDGLRTPVVALTANAMAGDREKCLRAGMDDYVSKPVSPAKLADVLERWMRSASSSDRASQSEQPDRVAVD